MNSRHVCALIALVSCYAWSLDEQLKDPTAPFNAEQSAAIKTHRSVAKPAGPRWLLDGVLISEEGKKALLNGRWYQETENVGGWQVALIETSSVLLKRDGKSQRIQMYPNLTTKPVNLQPE